jgi:carboxylesterase
LLPGHGTSWQDMNRTTWRDWYGTVEDAFHALRSQLGSRPLFAMGLSMGGTLVTRLAQVHQDQLSGIVLVNPSFTTLRRAAILAPILSRLVPSIKGLGGDIKQDQLETGTYNRTPLRAFASLRQLWRLTRANLASIRLPVAVFHSAVDHVVEPINTQLFLDAISSTDVTATELPNSYHVATLDHDAPTIFSGSLEFVHRLVASPEPEGAV